MPNEWSHPLKARTPLPRRRRVSLACTSCRQRKSRCDGQRPSCSPCLHAKTGCKYEDVSRGSNSGRQRRQNAHVQLKRKLGELEARLNSVASLEARHRQAIAELGPGLPSSTSPMTSASDPGRRSSTFPLVTPAVDTEHDTSEVAVDTLATTAFDGQPEDPKRNIGHFGPTSNHALFRALADVFARVVHLYPPSRHHTGTTSPRSYYKSDPPLPYLSVGFQSKETPDPAPGAADMDALSNHQDLILSVNQFFSTVGMVLPYFNMSAILLECNRAREEKNKCISRPMRALVNMICAYASTTWPGRNPEVYYRQALALLDEQTLRGSSLELIQALLLISSFQQNSQRSVACWTHHAVAVKAAFQLGLHSPKAYKHNNLPDNELCKRVWYAVVNQDRNSSISLGRPCMIPDQHVQVELPQDPSSSVHTILAIMPDQVDSLLYFNHNIALHHIKGSIIDTLYSHNIELLEPLPLEELIIRRLRLSWRLEQWREHTVPFCKILSDTDLDQWNAVSYHTNRYQVLLSIQYYSTTLLINFPVLATFLTEGVLGRQSERDFSVQIDGMILVIKNDLAAAKELSAIIHGAATSGDSFLDCNAAWWMCNYIMFTVNLHLFGTLLICKFNEAILSNNGIGVTEVRLALDRGLKIHQIVQRSSLMSRKAGHCLSGFLKVFDSLTPKRSTVISSSTDSQDNEHPIRHPSDACGAAADHLLSDDLISQYVAQSADDFLFMCSDNNFLDADFAFSNETSGFNDVLCRY